MYKILISSKPLRIRFDKTDGFNRVYGRTGYLVLLGIEKYDFIYDRVKCLINLKNGITYIISDIIINNQSRFLRLFTTRGNVTTRVKSVWTRDKNNYECNIFIATVSYELPKE